MPVTARLSKRFYDAIGDDAANDLVNWMNAVDLTYRTELLQHNEANFTRFVTLLDSRIAEFRAAFLAEMDRRFDKIEQRLDRLEERLGTLESRVESFEIRMDARFSAFESKMLRWMLIFWTTTMLGVGGIVFAALQAR